jgi:hypothetical protein
MKQQSKLTNQQQQQLGVEQQATQQSAREFATPEELLRYDAGQTVVPPAIAQRLGQSAADLPKPKRSWWQRWFD